MMYKNDKNFLIWVRDFLRGALDVPLTDPRVTNLGNAALAKYAQDMGFDSVDEFYNATKNLSNAYEIGMQYRPYVQTIAQGVVAYFTAGLIFGFSWFNLALSQFRVFNNLFNWWFNYSGDTWLESGTAGGTGGQGYIGTYEIKYWRYHPADGGASSIL